jgi:hypothetical protein
MRRWLLYYLVLLLLLPTTSTAQPAEIRFAGRTWSVAGDEVKVERYLGRDAARLRNGAIVLSDLKFENGIIEFDVATTGHRSFIGVAFRIHDDDSYEDFYIRPHNSGRFDATQYTPVFNRISAWQLYPEYNAAIEVPSEQWMHVRLEISGPRMRVFLNGGDEPDLVVDDLKCGQRQGAVALKSNFPAAGQPADLYPTAFANFKLTPAEPGSTYPKRAATDPRLIGRWAISAAMPSFGGSVSQIPREALASGWSLVDTEASGLVNLARHRGVPAGSRQATVFARVIVKSEREQVKKLNYGFSDRGSIFLNDQILFSGDNTYMSRSQRYLGVVTIDNDAIYLPLRQGENELVFAVSEAFGGWGLIARFEDLDGISVEARAP